MTHRQVLTLLISQSVTTEKSLLCWQRHRPPEKPPLVPSLPSQGNHHHQSVIATTTTSHTDRLHENMSGVKNLDEKLSSLTIHTTPQHSIGDSTATTATTTTTTTSAEMENKSTGCKLLSLPSEILHQILLLLPEISLYSASLTCKRIQALSLADPLWENILNSPDLPSPHPYLSYRALHHALSPHLYLKRKIFIGDRQFFGSFFISKYSPVSGTLEAFSLAVSPPNNDLIEAWSYNPTVLIYPFSPRINLRDEPEFKIAANSKASEDGEIPVSRRGILATYFRADAILERDVYAQMAVWPPRIIPSASRVRNESSNGFRSGQGARQRGPFMRLPSGVSINGTSVSIGGFGNDVVGAQVDRSAFMMAKAGEKKEGEKWRVDRKERSGYPSDKAFRLRRWAVLGDPSGDIEGRFRMGERVETFAELDEELWTPTEEYPYRGIWIGNSTTPEFLLFHQPVTSGPRKRLEVIKLTGDPNVPRGEYYWIIDDLSSPVRMADEDEYEWPSAKVYEARAHIADQDFKNDRFVNVQVILPSAEKDWQDSMALRRQQKTQEKDGGGGGGEDVRPATNEVGEGWGVGSEERGSASGTAASSQQRRRRNSARRNLRKNWLEEAWVPRRAAVYWYSMARSIQSFERVDIEKFLD
ncbi:hypothetical protein AA313_de0203424 [Arthrobotrys entomopaga]|nr:hypothetical protein AA313_de0203424 [Arthrobotrys entomopaga]